MKLNYDCVRKILLAIESQTDFMCMDIDSFCRLIPDYSPHEITYCCLRLHEGGYLHLITGNSPSFAPHINDNNVCTVGDLTMQGHEFLAKIRDNNNWKKIKSISSSVGFAGLKIISSIAEGVATAAINQQLGFPE